MTTKRSISTVTPLRGTATLALVLIGTLVATACGGASGGPVATPAAGGSASPTRASSNSSASTPVSSKTGGNLNCQAIVNAAFDLNGSEPFLITLANSGGSTPNKVDSPFYVDTAKLRADLDELAAVPDPTDAAAISMMGKPSEAISQFRQLLDLIDKDANAQTTTGATPSTNGGTSDQQLLDFGAKFIKMSTAINSAVSDACPGVSAEVPQPGAQATPQAASYRIGETATVGDLSVTLDKVVSLAGSGGLLPTAGNRFVFVYITVENRGKSAFQTNMLSGTHWEDSGGNQYFMDPFSIGLDPASTNLDGGLDPGAKKSGSIGYQLPMAGGDMVWIFKDFGPNQAVFAVKASDIASAGTPVTEATDVALRAQLDATQTAFVQMAEGADSVNATHEALGTDTPVVPEANDTVMPEVPTDTPGVQDTPAPDEPTDTPFVSP